MSSKHQQFCSTQESHFDAPHHSADTHFNSIMHWQPISITLVLIAMVASIVFYVKSVGNKKNKEESANQQIQV